MNRRSFFSGLLAAACASALRFYPAPQKPVAQVPEFPPAKAERVMLTQTVVVTWIQGNPTVWIRTKDGKAVGLIVVKPGTTNVHELGSIREEVFLHVEGPGNVSIQTYGYSVNPDNELVAFNRSWSYGDSSEP